MGRRFVDIIYEDRDLMVVNKPRLCDTAVLTDDVHSYLLRKYSGAKGAFVKPLHRLDKETTGLVIFAKSKIGERLTDAIKTHKVKRTYIAVVEDAVEKEAATIDMPLTKRDFGYGKKVGLALKGEGMEARTKYRVIERYENASILEVELETGRTHQIRVHLAAIGHPLIGDKVYNPYGKTEFPRQALHAAEIIFYHPSSGKKLKLSAKYPADMEDLIDRLRSF